MVASVPSHRVQSLLYHFELFVRYYAQSLWIDNIGPGQPTYNIMVNYLD